MSGRYRVTNRLGLFAAGRRFSHGEEADLTDEEAAPLLAAGAVAQVGDKAKAVQSAENKVAKRASR